MSFVRVRGHRVHVQQMGDGPPVVVFVHGMLVDNMASWFFTLAPAVAEQARAVLYDLRGHGKSERTETGYTLPELVADLDALLDALEFHRPVVLVGNSFGGLLALDYALAHQERVAGLVLIDANVHDEEWNRDIAERFARGREDDRAVREEMARYAYRYAGRDSERKRSRLAATARSLVEETTFVDDLSSSPPFSREELRSLDVPVLALYGADSELAGRARRTMAELPDCETVWFRERSHLLLWEAAGEIRREVTDWLHRLD